MKKLTALISMLAVVLLLVACGRGNDSTTSGKNTYPTTNATETTYDTLCATESATGGNAATDSISPETTPDTTTPTTDPVTNTTTITQSSHTHSYATTVTAPTCTNEGYTTHKCSCGNSYISNKTSPTGHSFGQWETTKAATATATGTAQRVCSKCNAKETKTLGKLSANHSHDYTRKVTQAATCTQEGVQTYTCSCGDSFTDSLPKESHDLKLTAGKEPDCMNAGYDIAICSVCGYSVDIPGSPADPAAHIYAKTEQPATCTESGSIKYTCTVCSVSYSETTNALGHDFRAISCESNMVCDRCGGAGDYFEHAWRGYVEDGKPSLEKPNYCGLCGIVWCDYYGHIWGSDGHCMWRFCDECIPE